MPDQADARRELERVMSALAAARAFGTPLLDRADPASLSLAKAHRLALLGLDVLLDVRREPRPKPIGWRFLIEASGLPIAAAEALGPGPDGYRFGALNEGPLVGGFSEALARAERAGDAMAKGFEPWLLLVPALNVGALWMAEGLGARHAFGPHDLFLAIPPSQLGAEPFTRLSRDAFLDGLREVARDLPLAGAKGG